MGGVTKIDGCYLVSAQSGGGHFGPPRKLETFVSYDFERWLPAASMGFMRGNIPPRPVVYEQHAGEQVHLGAGLWNRGNVIIGVYGQWHGHPSNDRRLVTIDLGLVVSNDGLHYREPIPDFRLVEAAEHGWKGEIPGQTLHFPAIEQGQGFENIGDQTVNLVRLVVRPRRRLRRQLAQGSPGLLRAVPRQQDALAARGARRLRSIDLEGKPARVFLNVDGLSEHSRVDVEVLSERLEAIPGYVREECVAPTASGLRQPVRWREHDRIRDVDGPVRLRLGFGGLRPEDPRVYAIYVEESD